MNPILKSIVTTLAILAVSSVMLFLPYEQMGLALNPVQIRVVAMFVFAALMWILEPIPVWATSVLLIQLCLFTASDQSLPPFKEPHIDKAALTQVIQNAAPGAPTDKVEAVTASSFAILNKMTKTTPANIQVTVAEEFHLADLPDAATALHTPEMHAAIEAIPCVNVMQYKNLLATFADPIIILFLGGFFLAAAATKYQLDINLANVMLRPFGDKPRNVMLGLMTITAIFAMFMSNTATTAMMIALVAPVLAIFKNSDRGRIGFALCIPAAANIGGMGTPIGTPPNAIALKAMQNIGLDISFGKWMMMGVPFVILMVLVAWVLLLKLYPCEQKEIKLRVKGIGFIKSAQAYVVYATFIITIAMWVMGSGVHGLNSNVIAFIPITIFCVTGVITEKDLASMNWSVLWLVAGGFALGQALQDTGLAADLIGAIPFETWSIVGLLVGAGFICMFMSTFMSNTATANLLIPILASLAGVMMGAGIITSGWALGLLVGIALSASMGMALPISTPPNALAYATGFIKTKDMAITGTILCTIGFALACVMVVILLHTGFFG